MRCTYSTIMRIFLFSSVFIVLFFLTTACKANNRPKNCSEIVVYKISRETFSSFLDDPSLQNLEAEENHKNVYSESGQKHTSHGARRIEIDQPLLDFAGDKTAISAYLSQHGVEESIQNTTIIDAPLIPLTIWVQTKTDHRFITIQQDDNDTYVYTQYTLSDYSDTYDWTPASLVVNGKEIQTVTPIQMYTGYADVPFVTVLQALGATIKQQPDQTVELSLYGKEYILNTNERGLYEVDENKDNLFNRVGSPIFVYVKENELIVDTYTLHSTLRRMGESIVVSCDKAKKVVTIQQERAVGQ